LQPSVNGRSNDTHTESPAELRSLPGNVSSHEAAPENQSASRTTGPTSPDGQHAQSEPAPEPAGSSQELNPVQQAALNESLRIKADSNQTEANTQQLADTRKQAVRETIGTQRNNLTQAFNTGRGVMEQIVNNGKEYISSTFTMLITIVTSASTNIFNTAGALLSMLQTSILTFVLNLAVSAGQMIRQVTERLTNILYTIPLPDLPGVAEVRSAINNLLLRAAGMVAGVVMIAFSFLQNVIRRLMQRVRAFLARLFQLVSTFLGMVINTITRVFTLVMGTLDRVVTLSVTRVGQVLEIMVYPIFNIIENRLFQAIDNAKDKAVSLIRINRNMYLFVLARVIRPAGKAEEVKSQPSADPIAEIRQLGDDARRNNRLILTTFQMITGGIIPIILQWLDTEISLLTDRVFALISTITLMVNNIIQATINSFMGVVNMIGVYLTSLFDHLTIVMTRAITFFYSLASGIVERMAEFGRSAFTRIRDVVVGIARNILRFITGGVTGILEAVGVFNPNVSRQEMPDTPLVNAINHAYPRALTRFFSTISKIFRVLTRIVLLLAIVTLAAILVAAIRFIQRAIAALQSLIIISVLQTLLRLWLMLIRPRKAPATAPAPSDTEYSPGTGIDVSYSVPLVNKEIQASEGEKMIFGVEASDNDRMRKLSAGSAHATPWTTIPGTGPYETIYQVVGDAEFNVPGSKLKSQSYPTLETRNTLLFVHKKWNRKTITVKARLRDKAPAVKKGSLTDREKSVSWTIVPRKNPAPTGLKRISGPGSVFQSAPVTYGYEATPPIPGRRPAYRNQTVLESFSDTRPLFFTMADVKPEWKAANPSLDTPEKVAVHLYGTSNNGTFVFNEDDQMFDRHSGFGDTSPFTDAALARSPGIGYSKKQVYSCGGKAIGSALLERRFNNADGIRLRKTGP
jgi:hypothetical protein